MVGAALDRPTIDFDKPLGVNLLEEWKVCRLSGGPLEELAAQAPVATESR
ncbi:Acetyltransferase OS=Streptomyces aurantiogriseus OX=66870 GN=GCM10010251_35700 PE=4 SV=1 [Streptomyces aurantiogriseus]